MLKTDANNLAESHAAFVRQTVALYHDRRQEGQPHSVAYCQAVAYLRRKTLWPVTLAAAALADGLREHPNPV